MELVLVTIGAPAADVVGSYDAAALLRRDGHDVEALTLPDRPTRLEYDAVLDAALCGRTMARRLVIDARPDRLAGLLRRMMRRGELATAETAVLSANCRFLTDLDITIFPEDFWADEPCRTVGVLKDDSGNLVIDSAELRPWTGAKVWVRAYVDDECLCDGEVAWLRVQHRVGGGLRASVPGRFGRTRSLSGRGLSLACDDAAISSDGAARDQPRRKRIWWDEPEQWRLACPPAV